MVKVACEAMRTRWEIALADEDDPARLRAAGEEALGEIQRVEERLSPYRSSSDLAFVNARAALGPVRVSPPFFAFLQRAIALSRATNGAFDLSVGPLLVLWGFAGKDGRGDVPPTAEIEAARTLLSAWSETSCWTQTR
jgi:thiamine biosynthesis lipoprotein